MQRQYPRTTRLHLTASFSNLQYLFLAENPFTPGPLPNDVWTITTLVELSLKSTKRRGPLAEPFGFQQFGYFQNDLTMLDLDRNELTGTIPAAIGNLNSLQILLLNRNKLTGTLPSSMGNLSNMSKLELEVA